MQIDRSSSVSRQRRYGLSVDHDYIAVKIWKIRGFALVKPVPDSKISTGWLLGIIAVVIILTLRQNRYAPAAVLLMVLGIVIVAIKGQFIQIFPPSFRLPPRTGFSLEEVWRTTLLAGFAQIPLTVTNATISTAALIKTYWPDKPVTERQLSMNQGIMNVVLPFFGGMPMCHGAGGLAGQYYFGARTGGTNIIETAFTL